MNPLSDINPNCSLFGNFLCYLPFMRIIAKRTLREFWEKYNDAEVPLRAWYDRVKIVNWQTPEDVKTSFGNASIIANNRVVFNIKGNHYRLVIYIVYKRKKIFIRFIGNHREYNKIDAKTI